MKLNLESGPVEVEGIDINVWNSDLYGSGPANGVVITGYAVEKDANGYWVTNTGRLLFSLDTDLDADNWDDGWYDYYADKGLDEETPPEVAAIVEPYIKSILVKS